MAVIYLNEYRNRPSSKLKAISSIENANDKGISADQSTSFLGLDTHNSLDAVASQKVERQISLDLSLLSQEFFETIPTTQEQAVIRLYSEYDTNQITIEGDILHPGFYKALFNYDESYIEAFQWLKLNITMMAHAKEVSDFSLQYPSRQNSAAERYTHLTMEDKGILFVLEYRDNELTAFAESPLRRYYKRIS